MRMHTRLVPGARLAYLMPLAAGALTLLLAACGHSSAPATSGDPDAAQIASSHADGDGSRTRDDALKAPPPGTLHYTITLAGDLHQPGTHPGEKRDATIRRKLDVTTRMQATLTSGALDDIHPERVKDKRQTQPASTPLDGLAKQAEACDGDAACMMKISMKLMADPKAQKAVQDAGNQMAAMIGRTAIWSRRAPCEARIAIEDSDDRATWWEDAGEGYYKTGLNKHQSTTHADDRIDCKPNLLSDDPAVAAHLIADGTQVFFDRQTGDYDITFGPTQLEVAPTVNGKRGKPRNVGTPEIALTGFSGAASGKPFSGSRTVEVKNEDDVPLRADIHWTFTPDKG